MKSSRGDFNDFGEFAIIKLIHIIAHPFTITEDVVILFTIFREKILCEVSIKTRGLFSAVGTGPGDQPFQ